MTDNSTQLSADDLADVEDQVVRLLAEVLYLEPDAVDRQSDFSELGLDSVLVVEFGALLQEKFEITVSATTIYEHRSPHEIARYLTR